MSGEGTETYMHLVQTFGVFVPFEPVILDFTHQHFGAAEVWTILDTFLTSNVLVDILEDTLVLLWHSEVDVFFAIGLGMVLDMCIE